jgi:hypothetical protein
VLQRAFRLCSQARLAHRVLSALEMIDCPVLAADLVHRQWLSTGKIRKTANQISTTIVHSRKKVRSSRRQSIATCSEDFVFDPRLAGTERERRRPS